MSTASWSRDFSIGTVGNKISKVMPVVTCFCFVLMKFGHIPKSFFDDYVGFTMFALQFF